MNKQQHKIDSVIQIIPDIKVRTLVREQIEQLQSKAKTVFANKNRVFIRLALDKQKIATNTPDEQILFIIKLKKGFPISPPRVYMQSSITNPTTFDLRDYLDDIIQKQWNYSIALKQIEENLPNFVNKLLENKKNPLALQKIGYFHLGQFFSYNLLKQCKGIQMFLAFWEVEETVIMDYITVSDCHIVVLRPQLQPILKDGKLHVPQQQKIDNLRLMSYADVQAVSQIRISRTQNSEVQIVLKTQKFRKMAVQTCEARLHYRVVKHKELVKKILRVMPKLQSVQMNYETDIQNGVRIAESNLKKYFNKDNINLLNSYYQNAVQHLSGLGNPAYLVYLNKITQLSLREDVKLVTSVDK